MPGMCGASDKGGTLGMTSSLNHPGSYRDQNHFGVRTHRQSGDKERWGVCACESV